MDKKGGIYVNIKDKIKLIFIAGIVGVDYYQRSAFEQRFSLFLYRYCGLCT